MKMKKSLKLFAFMALNFLQICNVNAEDDIFSKIEEFLNETKSQANELKAQLKIMSADLQQLKIQITAKSNEPTLLELLKEKDEQIENLTKQLEQAQHMKQEIWQQITKITNEKSEKEFENKILKEQQLVKNNELHTQLQNCTENAKNQTEIIKNLQAQIPLPTNCETAMKYAKSNATGTYKIDLPQSKLAPFDVKCENIDDENWLLIQRRQNGLVKFNRNWLEYKNGFGYLDDEFWLGLEKLHQLTKREPYELKIWLQDHEGRAGYAGYDRFVVGDEEAKYNLKVQGFYGNVTDCLKYINGIAFSTSDRDNDNQENGSCALDYMGGWWFDNCSTAHLNGPYNASDKYHWGINWMIFGKKLKYSKMAIRRVDCKI